MRRQMRSSESGLSEALMLQGRWQLRGVLEPCLQGVAAVAGDGGHALILGMEGAFVLPFHLWPITDACRIRNAILNRHGATHLHPKRLSIKAGGPW